MTTIGRTQRSWRSTAVWLVVIAVIVWAGRSWYQQRWASKPETFRRVPVERQEVRVTKTATGEVQPQNRVEVQPPIAGRIEEVLVREGDLVQQGQILAWMSSTDRAALLDAARADGKETLARWETAYKPAPLIAPLDGTLIVRAVEPGQTVSTDDPVVVIADRLIVIAQVDETDIGAMAVDQPAAISLDAYPQEEIPARVDHVAYEAKTVNNVTIYEVDVVPQEVPPFMRSGMTATVTVTVEAQPDVLVVPSEAVRQEGKVASVQVPSGLFNRSERKDVTLGLSDGKWTEVVSGLQEGEIVLAPALRLPRSNGRAGRNPFGPNRPTGGGRRQ